MRELRTPIRGVATIKTQAYIWPFMEMLLRTQELRDAIRGGWVKDADMVGAEKMVRDTIGKPDDEIQPYFMMMKDGMYEVTGELRIYQEAPTTLYVSDADVFQAAQFILQHPKFKGNRFTPLMDAFKILLDYQPNDK